MGDFFVVIIQTAYKNCPSRLRPSGEYDEDYPVNLFISDKTTANDIMDGQKRLGLTKGKNSAVKIGSYESMQKQIIEATEMLNTKLGSENYTTKIQAVGAK